ncbi:Hypothetical protein SMAX5B_015773 [Scophthalmus maximus]|uniref:Uncharacterized protein n=1 Tax=Scophthalmus maximus TaxID=52904 RepID=A0A2U9CZW8_SCOMX|nr:Hypothetical protein SMAX5B_015773 [Scophthalmus maximus]
MGKSKSRDFMFLDDDEDERQFQRPCFEVARKLRRSVDGTAGASVAAGRCGEWSPDLQYDERPGVTE